MNAYYVNDTACEVVCTISRDSNVNIASVWVSEITKRTKRSVNRRPFYNGYLVTIIDIIVFGGHVRWRVSSHDKTVKLSSFLLTGFN